MDGYSCAIEFDTSDSQFIRGVEVGRLWEMLKHEDEPEEQVVHASNAEMLLRLAEASDRSVRSEELDGNWIAVNFGAVGSLTS